MSQLRFAILQVVYVIREPLGFDLADVRLICWQLDIEIAQVFRLSYISLFLTLDIISMSVDCWFLHQLM